LELIKELYYDAWPNKSQDLHSLLYICSQRYALSEKEQKVEALPVSVMKGYSRSQVMAPITITSALLDGGKW